jgi:dinuclear metal center YbgI/SA1388 family protein
MSTIAAVTDYLERFAPRQLAASWDNVGLLVGDRSAAVERIMTCLTVTPESAAEAIAERAQLIVTHHPVLFRPVQRLTADDAQGRMLLELIRAGVAVYSPHTAFDNTAGGINDILARQLGLTNVTPLRRQESSPCKLVVFVPDSDLTKVSDAIFAAGAGQIGEYRECSFRLSGTGTFFGGDSSNPAVGQKGRREEVSEWRLEAICPADQVEQVVAAMRQAHSYEEPAFDVYNLRPQRNPTGEGRVGALPQPAALADLARKVKDLLRSSLMQWVGEPGRNVARVAIACGAAGDLLNDAIQAKADVFLTGELRFHDYLTARARGIGLILPGHYATERIGVEELAGRLGEQFKELKVWASRRETDPVGLV